MSQRQDCASHKSTNKKLKNPSEASEVPSGIVIHCFLSFFFLLLHPQESSPLSASQRQGSSNRANIPRTCWAKLFGPRIYLCRSSTNIPNYIREAKVSRIKNQLYSPNTPNYVREQMFAQLRTGLRLPAVLPRKLQCRQNIGFESSARDGISLLEETRTKLGQCFTDVFWCCCFVENPELLLLKVLCMYRARSSSEDSLACVGRLQPFSWFFCLSSSFNVLVSLSSNGVWHTVNQSCDVRSCFALMLTASWLTGL